MITFTVSGQPQGKARAKVGTFRGFARAYTPEKTAAYENLVKLCYSDLYGGTITHSAVRVMIKAFYRIPASMPKYRQLNARSGVLRPMTKPDLDNVVKIICDALNGIAYKDDTQVIEIIAEKFYSDNPRVEVIIEEICT